MKNKVIDWKDVVTFLLFPWMIWVSATLVSLQVGMAVVHQKLKISPEDFAAYRKRNLGKPQLANPGLSALPSEQTK